MLTNKIFTYSTLLINTSLKPPKVVVLAFANQRFHKTFFSSLINSYSKILFCRSKPLRFLFFKRFYPGHDLGPLARILSNKNIPKVTQNGPTHVPPKGSDDVVLPPIHEITKPSNSDSQGFPFNTINATITDKTSIFQKMSATILKMIPSTRPRNLSNTLLDAKDAHIIQEKEALVMFLNYFPQLPQEYILEPDFLMLYHKLLSENHPEVFGRTYQLAMETFLNKRVFYERNLCDVFENKFLIEDFVGRNQGISRVDTLITATQTNHLYTQPGFAKHVDVCIIIPTVRNSHDWKNWPPVLQDRIQKINKATGNIFNDIDLNGHHYDFKITNKPSFGQNHIMFINVNFPQNDFDKIIDSVVNVLRYKKNLLEHNKNDPMSVRIGSYYEKLLRDIKEIQYQAASNAEKYSRLNDIIFRDLHKRPEQVYVPIFIPITKEPFQPHPQLNKFIPHVTVPSSKISTEYNIRDAISKTYQNWAPETKKTAFIETMGSIGKEEVD
jgi:hypothetical protein